MKVLEGAIVIFYVGLLGFYTGALAMKCKNRIDQKKMHGWF